jgi:outer membrane protein insertion porin family
MLYKTNITEKFGNPELLEEFSTSALSLLFVIENRDNPFNPTKGEFFSTTLKVALPLFSNTVFYKFFWNYQNNWKFLKTGVFSFSVRNGFADGDLHISERFFAGGSHTFRGAPNDRLGPINTDYDQPRGGEAMILLNLEATFPLNIIPIDNLYYSVFLDVGNIYWDTKDFNIQKVEKALGFALKYKTPMGPLKIEFAWNFRGHNADRFFNLTIGIGNVF